MNFEKPDNNQEAEQDPEILEQANELNEQAAAVGEQLEGVDPSELNPNQLERVEASAKMIMSALLTLASVEGIDLILKGTMEDVMQGHFSGLEAAIATVGTIAGLHFITMGLEKFAEGAKKFFGKESSPEAVI